MNVVLGKTAGFCPGVMHTIDMANKTLELEKNVYCLGEIVHNGQVIKSLEEKGMTTVDAIDEIPDGAIVIFRAHGEAKSVYEKAEKKNLKIIDLTCGKVKAIHVKVERESKDKFIIILGKKTHPETIGTKGFAGENSYVIESQDDILDAYVEYEKTNLGEVYIAAQTTFSSKKFDEIVEEIKDNFIEANITVDKTICDATEIRQKETEKIASSMHSMVIIGGKHSSNTKELAVICEKYCKDVYLVETLDELKNMNLEHSDSIGLMAGASTPKDTIEKIKKYLESI